MRTSTHESREVMVSEAQIIRISTGWDNLVHTTTNRAYLMSKHGVKASLRWEWIYKREGEKS